MFFYNNTVYLSKMKRTFLIGLVLAGMSIISCNRNDNALELFEKRDTKRDGFVYVENKRFMLDGNEWFPLMLNYRNYIDHSDSIVKVSPSGHYYSNSMADDFKKISDMGFNCLRICLKMSYNSDTAAVYQAIGNMIDTAAQANLRVMMLLNPPFDITSMEFVAGMLRHFANTPAIWAYDFFNEPLYFDEVPDRNKIEAYKIVSSWRKLMCENAPNQLFTIGFSEPIEVFEWDPIMLPVDFVEMHTYHPLRVASEMYWYSNNCTTKPWMVGEISLPADNDSVSYEEQQQFMLQSFAIARSMGAAGFGWWEYMDNPNEVNFEGKYTALINPSKIMKPAAYEVATLMSLPISKELSNMPPNYYNMVGYNNIALSGRIIDDNGRPVSNALIRGWTEDWIGMNTYSDNDGCFVLYSNDFSVHFEVSAPYMGTTKFHLDNIKYTFADSVKNIKWKPESFPNRYLEYQSIDYHPFLEGDSLTLIFNPKLFNRYKAKGCLGTVKLKRIKIRT
jgi:hypothetical protein